MYNLNRTKIMKNKKIILVIIGVVIALVILYFVVSWLIQIAGHVPRPH